MNQESKNALLKKFIDDFWDLILLNILFVLSVLPIISCGAALAGLYMSVSNMQNKQVYGGAAAMYWYYFRQNLKQPTLLWLISLLAMILLYVDSLLIAQMSPVVEYGYRGLLLFIAILIQTLLTVGIPLSAFGQNSLIQLIRKSLSILAIKPLSTIIACLIQGLPLVISLLSTRVFAYLFLLWISIYFSLVALINSALLMKTIKMMA
jgi:uncharacterized membrane protein YesL